MYGVEDADGRRPDWGTFFRDRIPAGSEFKVTMRRGVAWQRQLLETAESYLRPYRKLDRRAPKA